MYVRYANFQHIPHEVNLENYQRFVIYNQRGRRRSLKHRMTLTGELQYDTQAALSAAIEQFETAYNEDGMGDIGLYQDDGTLTPHHLINNTSLAGVKIVYIDFPKGDAAEYATKRSFRLIAEAEYLDPEDGIVSFSETLSYLSTGGPCFSVHNVARGAPIAIQRCQRTAQHIVQSGHIVGLISYGLTPGPIFPAYEHLDRRQFMPGSPKVYGGSLLDWPSSYAFYFTLPSAGSALPSIL